MVTGGIAMRAQDGVAAAIWSIGRRQPAIGLVGDRRLGHDRAVGQREIAHREETVLDGADLGCGGPRPGGLRIPSAVEPVGGEFFRLGDVQLLTTYASCTGLTPHAKRETVSF